MSFNAALSTFEVMKARIKCGNHYVRELTRMLTERGQSKAFRRLAYWGKSENIRATGVFVMHKGCLVTELLLLLLLLLMQVYDSHDSNSGEGERGAVE
jgi:hypothetical protein